ncbi:MAG: DUF4411 family protein [Geminicoccaceae bacterium]
MLYLLDANVLITAHNSYYAINRVPEFWEWLAHICSEEHAKVPLELYEEITEGNDALADWARDDDNRSALLLEETVDGELVSRVVEHGYAPDLTDDELEKIGRDPFLIAYALVARGQRCVVTTEVSKQKRTRANRHMPDVCATMGVQCIDSFQFLRALDFRTSWRAGS